LQNFLAACRVGVGRSQDIAAAATQCLDADGIAVAHGGNRAGQQRFAGSPHANLAAHVAGDALAAGLSHQLQGLVQLAVGEDIEERRLFEVDRQGFFERAVENRIAGSVCEVGDHDGVFLGQGLGPVRAIVESASDQRRGQQNRDHDRPGPSAVGRRSFSHRRCTG